MGDTTLTPEERLEITKSWTASGISLRMVEDARPEQRAIWDGLVERGLATRGRRAYQGRDDKGRQNQWPRGTWYHALIRPEDTP